MILDSCECRPKARIYLLDIQQPSIFCILYSRSWISKPFRRIGPKVFRLCPFCSHILQWKLFHVIACTYPKIRCIARHALWYGKLTRPNSKKASFILISGAPLCGLSLSPTPAHFLYMSQFSISLPQPALTFCSWIHHTLFISKKGPPRPSGLDSVPVLADYVGTR